MSAIRYLPDVPFPPYTFVPGRAPHPYTDPRGHSHGLAPAPPEPLDPGNWRVCRAYLSGVDLFNYGYYWEADEAWECAWNGVGRKGLVAEFLKALIKLAAAGVKLREGVPAGVERHACRAAEILQDIREQMGECFVGFNLDLLIAFARTIAREASKDVPIPALGPIFSVVLQLN